MDISFRVFPSTRALLLAFTAALFLASPEPASAGEWHTIHKDNQRSGYTDEVLSGPFERKWFRDFHGEMIASRVEAIVAEGLCFVGTFAGNVHALKVEDGSTAWTFKAGGPIGSSPHYEKGRLLIGSDDGALYCLNAADGKLLWRYEADGGIWVAPACDGERVYFGDRSGVFHAVALENGKRLWTLPTQGMILTPASITEDSGKIVFGSEDMHVYCADRSGRLLWKSGKLQGLSLRDHAPTLWKGLAIVQTNPADGFHEVMNRQGDVLKEIQRKIPIGAGEKVLLDKWNDYIVTPSPERRAAEQEGIIQYLRLHRHDRTFYALKLEDGKEPWIAPIFYTAGLHNPPTAPTFNPRTGDLYVIDRTALTTYLRGVRRYAGIAKLDRDTGKVAWSWPEEVRQESWYAMPLIGDETQALSLMGDWLIGNHQGMLTALDPGSLKLQRIWDGRDTYGGIFGPGAVPGGFDGARRLAREGVLTGMPNEWHGPDRSIVAIAGGRLFWVVGSQVVCLGGPEIKATASGGFKPPALIRSQQRTKVGGNVAVAEAGGGDAELAKTIITAEQVRRFLQPASSGSNAPSAATTVQKKLEAAVTQLITGGAWAPLVVELGISGEERHFWRTAETIQILSLALPHLSEPVRAKAKAYLDALVQEGAPLKEPVHSASGKRREPYDLGPGMAEWARKTPQYQANIEDIYALWAYAHYADAWEQIRPQLPQIRQIFGRYASKLPDFEQIHRIGEEGKREQGSDLVERLNGQIAGVLAYARIIEREGDQEEVGRTLEVLAKLVTERVHHEKADPVLIRPVRIASHSLHQAGVPRYIGLTPELGAILREFAPEELGQNLRLLTSDLPVWYHAFGERMIGGENYISPPHLSRALFSALTDGRVLPAGALARWLDQPWGAADLYYIEKCAAVLRAGGGQPR